MRIHRRHFLIIAGMKYRKLLTIIAGLISISLIVVPIICIGYGLDLEGRFQFRELYIGVSSL